ncbi:MAG: tetratricopeptide repeat protein, partial [Methanothrix sp.]
MTLLLKVDKMTDDGNVFSLGILADTLCQPGGYEPKRLRSISSQGYDLVSPFIEAILSSDEDQMQKRLAGLADYLCGNSNSSAWFNLGRLAASLFFRRAAEEYFEKSARLAQAQGDGEGEAQAWLSLGILYRDDENWDQARLFYEKALQALDDGKSSPLMCSILINLGRAGCRQGDLSKAEQCYSRALRLLDGDDHPGRADVLYSLGELCQIRANYAGAEDCYQKSFSDGEKAGDRRAMAASLAALASVYQFTGATNNVESCLEKARYHLQDIGDEIGAARMRFQLADFFFMEGRLKEAVDHYEKSLPTLEEGDILLAARAQSRMGQCFLDLGDYALAEDNLEKAREIMQGQGDLCSVADLLILLAGNYCRQNRLDEALQCSRQCLEIREQQNDPHAIADAYSCMGQIYADRREYSSGKVCFQKAVDLLMPSGKCMPAAEALSNLGSLCHLNGDLEDALDCYIRALDVFRELGNEQGQSQTRANLGLIYQSKGEFSLAEDYLQKSLAARDGADVAGGAGIKLSLGLTAQCKGDWDNALDYFEEAAQAFEDLGDLHGFSLAQNNLGNLHSDRGDIRKAILCYNLSLDAKRAQNDLH